uniref:PAP2_C domain-containing protein n=1 Tax=Rhabditophanes sp. KR3021 TaxID=114890 RepID=A0AC35THZ3_9BILA
MPMLDVIMAMLDDVYTSSDGVPSKRLIGCGSTCSTSSSNGSIQEFSDSGSDHVEMFMEDNETYKSEKDPLIDIPQHSDRLSKTLVVLKGIKVDLKNALTIKPKSPGHSNENTTRIVQFPNDKKKCGIALVMLFFAAFCNDFTLSYIHERVPNQPPLPDIVFSNTQYNGSFLKYAEYLMLILFFTMAVVVLLHKYRWIIVRRIATIGSLLYLGRCVTMFVTQLPVADTNYQCSPTFSDKDRTLWNIFLRAAGIFSGAGLTINNKISLCGDYIYSGHTIVFLITTLFIREYSPKNFKILHCLCAFASGLGIALLLISRGHYTVDVVISYWITTRTFWEYHTFAANPSLRNNTSRHNHLRNIIWFPLCRYMESNILKPIPNKFLTYN